MKRPAAAIFLLVLLIRPGCAHREENLPGPEVSAGQAAEFRAAWVASVGNIDWPSRPGLTVDQQCAEIGAILDKAVDVRLNAIILQVRPCADALYASPYEPWSEYLTGRQGLAPSPLYDPLATWVAEAHKRGLQLHAWVNPFRARHISGKSPDAPNHVSNTRPQWVRKFNGYAWLDPGDPAARQYSLDVINDIVRRYDVDGIHIDDYFYPYAEYLKGADFPDEPTWQRYQQGGGRLSRGDWRRDNVNAFVRDMYFGVKRTKPNVQVGISPFGIWRPNNPPGTTGLDQYEKLYADARLWLNEGWCDYFVPQLYWTMNAKGHAYGDLLRWWVGQNRMGRRIYGGNKIFTLGAGANEWPVSEILEQIRFTRATPGASGNVFFSMKPLLQNRAGIGDALKAGPYARPTPAK